MGLSLTQRFGTGVTLDVSTPSAPKLIIALENLQNATSGGDIMNSQGLDNVSLIDETNKDNYADKIAAALLVLWKQKQPVEDTDETVGLYINDVYKQFYTRNAVEQLAFVYPVNVYIPDPTANLDPDDVV